jgi:alpha-D-xyloside xylohydrolase
MIYRNLPRPFLTRPHRLGLCAALLGTPVLLPVYAQAQTPPAPGQPGLVAANAVLSVQRDPNGLTLKQQNGTLRLQVFSSRVVRVFFNTTGAPAPAGSLAVINKPVATKWSFTQSTPEIVLKTAALQVRVNRATGAVAFYDAAGKGLLSEKGGGKQLTPATVGGFQTLRGRQDFVLSPGEAIFGLGQHQEGQMNYRGKTVRLQQRNTDVAVPVLVSSLGYGVLWDNPAVTDVNVGERDANTLTWDSEAGKAVDYYFMYGPEIDGVIQGYRNLTGNAPLFARYSWGLWQSRERYHSADELKDVVSRYRAAKIPFDGIIQDWQYWNPNPWGSHKFDPARFPDPKKMMDDFHADNTHLLISVWPKFDVNSPNADELNKAGALYPQVIPYVFPPGQGQWYDPFNPVARQIYWRQMKDQLFAAGVDGWWLDGSEVELSGNWGEYRSYKTGAGPGAEVYNAYPLMHTTAVYQGQRAATDAKRVYILTRSAYAGQQRNGSTTWSGDIGSSWDVLSRQIPAGINFALSGIPYWNTDTGGFFGNDPDNADFRERYARWFQFSTFCPMLRIHGTDKPKEIWRFSGPTRQVLEEYDQLRYHLLPYIYSTSWRVTNEGYTMMRGLVMDFRTDPRVYDIPDQFLFGSSLMACPVTKPTLEQGAPIPAPRLIDSEGNPGGLTGTYYSDRNFTNQVTRRKDNNLSFNWTTSLAPGLSHDNYSVRWEGSILTGKAGEYSFNLGADDGMRLWVDGKLIIEDWNSRAYLQKTATVSLPAQTRVPIKIEYYQDRNDARIDLTWREPGTAKKAPTRSVYLPRGTQWFDFWTGRRYQGGQTLDAAAPLETMPLFVKAGAVLPYGPSVQSSAEKADPLELRVYRGANGTFTLYEDEGDNYNYEKGTYSTIPFNWDEKSATLQIGARQGQFPGMMNSRTFRVVWVGENKGVGTASTPQVDKVVTYTGKAMRIQAPRV